MEPRTSNEGNSPTTIIVYLLVLYSTSFACEPSQNAPFPEALQPHHATVFASATCSIIGEKSDPACEPSQ